MICTAPLLARFTSAATLQLADVFPCARVMVWFALSAGGTVFPHSSPSVLCNAQHSHSYGFNNTLLLSGVQVGADVAQSLVGSTILPSNEPSLTLLELALKSHRHGISCKC